MKRLQAKINGKWEYVFCRNERCVNPITTKDRLKALPGMAIEYFQSKYGNIEFRVIS